jgi:hypothetical protein
MDLDAAIALLKVLSAAVAGVLGVAGVLFSYKDTDGKLTKWGLTVLSGIVLSSIIGVIASFAESAKARSESSEQAARTERILNELNRNLQPITTARAFYFVTFPANHPDVQRYVSKLTAYIEAHQKEFDAGQRHLRNLTTFPRAKGMWTGTLATYASERNLRCGRQAANS